MTDSSPTPTVPPEPECSALASALLEAFGVTERRHGVRLYQERQVRDLTASASLLSAGVRDGQLHRILIIYQHQNLVATCTCSIYAKTGLCRHLWAAVLAAGPEMLTNPLRLDTRVNIMDLRLLRHLGYGQPPAATGICRQLFSEDWQHPAVAEETPTAPPQGRDYWSPPPVPTPTWQNMLQPPPSYAHLRLRPRPATEEWCYTLVLSRWRAQAEPPIIQVSRRTQRKTGAWGSPRAFALERCNLEQAPAADREILICLQAALVQNYRVAYYGGVGGVSVTPALADTLFPKLLGTGRFYLQNDAARRPNDIHTPTPTCLRPDEHPEPWTFALDLRATAQRRVYELRGLLRRGTETRALDQVLALLPGGWLVWADQLSRLDTPDEPWLEVLRQHQRLEIPERDGERFLQVLFSRPRVPEIALPEALRCECVRGAPRYHLRLTGDNVTDTSQKRLPAELGFDYQGLLVWEGEEKPSTYNPADRKYRQRDAAAEAAARQRLVELGFRQSSYTEGYEIEARKLALAVPPLVSESWTITAKGKLFRPPGHFQLAVASGVDWFDLQAQCDFDGLTLELPALLKAAAAGQGYVTLGDGSLGILPADWLKKFGPLAALGEVKGDQIRFHRTQAMIIDALLAAQPDVSCDATFRRVREELHSFAGIQAGTEPAGFTGTLRPYQKFGLGWFQFLEKFGFGGCLADDMGLGKTVQVLALLQGRADTGTADRPASLVVMPRSLIFNWKREAERFAPALRIVDHTGAERNWQPEAWDGRHLVLTTYGTLKRDLEHIAKYDFDYVILDEAQAIKTATSQTAKAVRLLRGRQRLALSGTPVENHLGELWSLFEFLNPGMLGHAALFRGTGAHWHNPEPETRALIAHALRPFILRRTKRQVAPELPDKTEKTLMCELDTEQRRQYNELRDYYRRGLLPKVAKQGLAKQKIMVLEALLRLRQAACHPGLLDPAQNRANSAKLEALLAQLQEVTEEGHKALVFSQFVRFLDIVRAHLDQAGIVYEYLDGQTHDREARVTRFQTDDACPLFLISLKAGGLGLNLTAAEYVFLLDPWWNPAVEAQAIDRTHRIGQTRNVFAYRLIAKDTVEEKVLQLQEHKRDLADAVINADGSLLANLTREDLELLLG